MGSVASNRLCFLPCKRLMCAERPDTDECKEFAVKTLRPFGETWLATGGLEPAPRPPTRALTHAHASRPTAACKALRPARTWGILFICFGSEMAAPDGVIASRRAPRSLTLYLRLRCGRRIFPVVLPTGLVVLIYESYLLLQKGGRIIK